MGEVSYAAAFGAMGLVTLGMIFSYFTRYRPPGWVKIAVAAGAIAASAWFINAVVSPTTDIASVEDPLTVLLASVLVVHSFHVPSRRDLMFSLAASAGLMAVAGSQAITLAFGLYVVAWAGFTIWGLIEMWASASGGGRVALPRLAMVLTAVITAAATVFLVLPAPTVAAKLNVLSQAGGGGVIGLPGALAGDGGSPSTLSQPGTPGGPTRIGGYLGFANSLDTALRGKLGKVVVMLVRAQRPSYWVGETFDTWNGESWTATGSTAHALHQQSPLFLPPPEGFSALGQPDLQTFYVLSSTANLIFHAQSAEELWFPSPTVYYSEDGTLVAPIGLGKGAIYSVDSDVVTPTAGQLRAVHGGAELPFAVEESSLQLPHRYPRVEALAKSITAGDATNYDRVESLITWIRTHTHYSTDIPPLPAGADTVDEFLFGNRVGFCEQISTSLAVMLRSIGIPTREVVGYVPGSYNPITDLWQVRADDAHAWVQVWFPGYGWQSFDPTTDVPLANPTPGTTALADVGHLLRRIPLVPVATALLGLALAASLVLWRRTRPSTWIEAIARSAERAGRRAGRPRQPHETFAEYASALDDLSDAGSAHWQQLASPVEAGAYGGCEPPAEAQRELVRRARRLRADGRRARSTTVTRERAGLK